MTTRADAIVIGGGLVGLSSALQITRRGLKVLLLERSRIGRHSSGASAAGVRTLSRARAELPLSLAAMDMWHHLADLVGDNCGFHADGQLRVAETDEQLELLRAQVARLQRDGYDHEELIGANELRSLAPALAPQCIGAIVVRSDGAADPHRTLKAFLNTVLKAGVVVHEGCGVTDVRRVGATWRVKNGDGAFEAPLLVNAAGAWAGEVAKMAGDVIPIGTKASMMIVTERIAPFIKPTVSAVGRALSFKQTDQGTLLIGGGQQGRANLEAETSEIDARLLAKSAAAALGLFPSIRDLRIVRAWAGIEAKTEDNVAIVGLSPSAPGLVHLFGFSGHGFQLIPALGVVAAELLLDGKSSVDISGLSPMRLMKCSTRVGAPMAPASESETRSSLS